MPRKRNSTELAAPDNSSSPDVNDDYSILTKDTLLRLQQSPLWCSSVRNSISLSRMSDMEINSARSAALVPGSPLELGDAEGKLPVLLVEQPGGEGGWGAGWDVIIPAGW